MEMLLDEGLYHSVQIVLAFLWLWLYWYVDSEINCLALNMPGNRRPDLFCIGLTHGTVLYVVVILL